MYIRISEASATAWKPTVLFDLDFLGQPLGLHPQLPAASQALTRLINLTQAGTDPNQSERQQILAETKRQVEPNPYFGLADNHLDAALLATPLSLKAIRQPPEVLLALWTKEGNHLLSAPVNVPTDSLFANLMKGGNVTTASNAQVLARSFIFWNDLGADYFVHSPAGAKDNTPTLNDATVSDHEMRFTSAVQNLTNQGFVPGHIAATVTSELIVTNPAPGQFSVTPSITFYAGALALMGGLFSSLQRQSFPQLGSGPMSVGLAYIHWNIGTSGFMDFLRAADKYRKTAKLPTIEKWALHTRPLPGQWDQPRVNAIKFEFLVKAYAKVFPPPPPPMFAP